MMDFLRALTIGKRKGRVFDVETLTQAVAEGAAYLAQGASYSYIRARSGTMGPRLMQDADFGRGMERCKWEGFAACAQDLILIIENRLRPHLAPGRRAPADLWRDLYRDVLAGQEMPAHRRHKGWTDRIAEFDNRLARHLAAAPAPIEEIATHSGEVIMEFAPVEEAIRRFDRAMVVNNVRFRFIDQVTELCGRIDWEALARDIAAAGERPTP